MEYTDQLLVSYSNGSFLPSQDIAVSPWDLGYLRGYGVFDVMPIVNGKPFHWEWHFERLEKSAQELCLKIPVSRDEYRRILEELVQRNEGYDIIVRTVLSGGPAEDAFTPVPGKETFLVLAEAAHPLPPAVYETGTKIVTLEHVRTFPRVKMTHYVSAICSLPKRHAAGATETLYVMDGQISECAQSNIFCIQDGKLITTTESSLLGVTQRIICEKIAASCGIEVEVRPIMLAELLAAPEVFLTGSNKGIVPIVKIDERVIGAGVPGPLTKRLIEKYREYTSQY
ncbi:MAG: hypothetical protein A2808_00130 [Candidatus Moranbacteria bacterium RIFCSPHIGHO2_01_FULL_55_24]|nr:MAG: hypothetical protein A2808_00130 [Candidatus Moranbacteria bacterium RIFCSPHIGHO2_01_FULL_55_24]